LKFISSFFRFSILKGVTLQQEYRYFMILNKLSVVNFKNIRTASLDFSPKLNCLIGSNGMGKTNILDAVYYLSFCRSAFNPVDSQVITHNEEFMVLEGNYYSDHGDAENIYCGMKKGTRKHFKRNKKEYKRLSQHIGLIPIIFISPADASLIDGSSEERRKLMDMVIAQYDNAYMEQLSAYNKALQQRNALLKMEEEPDATLMEIWEAQMAEAGEAVYKKRDAFIKELVPIFQKIYSSIAGEQEEVSLNYISHCQRGALLDVIKRDRFKDRAVGYSLHGIHRDDLEMLLGGYQMRREGSQGQTKTFSLALKLAQFDFLCRTNSATTPLLLLDDIFDKLDAKRVEKIVQLVAGDHYGQIFITDTNRDHLDSILKHTNLDYKIFEVIDGDIRQRIE
jgi:DNA replication and repair protein RecF